MDKSTTLEERFGKCPYATAQALISGKWAVLILLYKVCPMEEAEADMIEAVQETREQLRAHLDEFPVRGGEGSILNR